MKRNLLFYNMYKSIITFLLLVILSLAAKPVHAQKDDTHYSKVFGSRRPYRVFLPEAYAAHPGQRFPVIYFLHGNKGDHRFNLEGIKELINQHGVILVAWNGRSVLKDERPYNVGYHANINYNIQFKDYFPEFVHHIDSVYRTIANRSGRGLLGHSMGGFMTFFLAGKYPDMVGAAVSMKGSSEFFVGYPGNHTLYNVKQLFSNLAGVHTRFHNSSNGELVYLNKEVNAGAQRETGLDYTYRVYPGGHDYTYNEFKDAFEFIDSFFRRPTPPPTRWHHADLYPNFQVWGYQVRSNLKEPGYIVLKGVTEQGLETKTAKWLPEGNLAPGVQVNLATAALYKPNTAYTLLDFNKTTGSKKTTVVKSDAKGKLRFSTNHQQHIFGIYEKNGPAAIALAGYNVTDNGSFLLHKKPCTLAIRLLNRGGSTARHLTITLSTYAKEVSIPQPVVEVDKIESGELLWPTAGFTVLAANEPPADGASPYIRFNLTITDEAGHTWTDAFDALPMYQVPEFTDIGIDDGDSEIFGSGNGNNIAEPGETVMIYQHSNRTRLYYDDPYIDAERLHDDLQPDKWGDGYALSSLIHISKDCPPGHVIRFLASYEIKEWKTIKRNVTWGTFTLVVGETGRE